MRDIDKPFVYVIDGLDENDTPGRAGSAIAAIRTSRDPREWEVFLGRLHERDDREQVAAELAHSFRSVAPPEDLAWSQARGLIELAEQGGRFTLGTVLT
jgi:hypothetical protein